MSVWPTAQQNQPAPIAFEFPEFSPPVVARAVEFLNDSVQWARVIEAPVQFAFIRLRRGRGTVRFRSGLRMKVDRRNRCTVENLVRLAFHGAILRGPGVADHRAWHVFTADGTIETPTGIRMALESLNPTIFDETFIRQIHFQGLDLSGKAVIDAGAFVGDTSLYFAKMGASVFAYEPDPVNFRNFMRNLALNPSLSARIRPVNAAVGADGEISFQSNLGGASGAHASGGTPIRIRSVSLGTILRENGLERPFLLKADIKGAEFELIRQPELGAFRRVAIEYQTYLPDQSPDQILDALRSFGFRKARIYLGDHSLDHGGMIDAERDATEG